MLHRNPGPIPNVRPRQQAAIDRLLALTRAPRPVPASRLARATHYAPSRLRVLSRRLLGEPPARRQRRRRLDAAACALLRDPRSVARAARIAGFRSTEAFHRAFRARFGCTPRAWSRAGAPPRAPRALALGAALARHFGIDRRRDHG